MASVTALTRATIVSLALAAASAVGASDTPTTVHARVEDIKARVATLTGEINRLPRDTGDSAGAPDQLVALDERLPDGLTVVAAQPSAALSYIVHPPTIVGLPATGNESLLPAPTLAEPSIGAWTAPAYAVLPRLRGGQAPGGDRDTRARALLTLAVGHRPLVWPLTLTVADLFARDREPERCIIAPDGNEWKPGPASLVIVRVTRTHGGIVCHLHAYPTMIEPADAAALVPEPPAAIAALGLLVTAGASDLSAAGTHLLQQWIGYGAPGNAARLLEPTDGAGVRILIARLLEQRGEAEKALAALEPATMQAPLLAARLYLAVDAPERALRILERAPPGHIEGTINGAVALQRLGRHRQACERLDEALTGRDGERGTMLEIARLRSGECWLRLGKPGRAGKTLAAMPASSQLAPRAQLMIGWALSQEAFNGGDVDRRVTRPGKLRQAITIWRPLLDAEGAVAPKAALAIANAQEALGEFREAEARYAGTIERLREHLRDLERQRRHVRSMAFAELLGDLRSPPYRRGWLRAAPVPKNAQLMTSLAEAMAEHRYQQLLNDYRDLADLRAHLDHQRRRLRAVAIMPSAVSGLAGDIDALGGVIEETAGQVKRQIRAHLLAALQRRQEHIRRLLSQAHLGLARTTEHQRSSARAQ